MVISYWLTEGQWNEAERKGRTGCRRQVLKMDSARPEVDPCPGKGEGGWPGQGSQRRVVRLISGGVAGQQVPVPGGRGTRPGDGSCWWEAGVRKNRDGADSASPGKVESIMSDPMLLIFPRPEVEAGNLAPLLRRFAPDKLPKGKELAAMMSTFHFAVDGWDDDPHEVYAIAAVRKFYQKLHREWPYAFFFCDLRGESLMMLTMGCLDNLEGQTKAGEALSQVHGATASRSRT